MKGQYVYEYPRPAVTADTVLFAIDGNSLQLLLIERGGEPYKGMWALPGGFLDMDETVDECAARELCEETGVVAQNLTQIGAFSAVGRDPRGRNICVAFWSVMRLSDCQPQAGDDAARVKLFDINNLPPLAFDHIEIISAAVRQILIYRKASSFGFEDFESVDESLQEFARRNHLLD